MGSGTVIYVPGFIKIDSGIQKLIEINTHQGDLISIGLFLQNKESRLRKAGFPVATMSLN
jgi:hypothetical protein